MSAEFYRAFEERYRGSRDLIRERLRVYEPFITPLLEEVEPPRLLDLGCGRGEWLELCRQIGFEVRGIDLDPRMLDACRELGLPVTEQDALEALRSHADGSLGVVSAFHLVEHLPFEVLGELVRETLRVLMPGGLLIMETPNPENISIATTNFWLDPTHLRPLPPLLLSFLPEHYGFERSVVVRVQEDPWLAGQTEASLADVLRGVSPDYAVVARKAGGAQLIPALDEHYGLDLDTLLQRHRGVSERRHGELVLANHQLQAQLQQVQALAETALARATLAEERSLQASVALEAIHASTSWQVTRPLRWTSALLRRSLDHLALWLQRRPALCAGLAKLPGAGRLNEVLGPPAADGSTTVSATPLAVTIRLHPAIWPQALAAPATPCLAGISDDWAPAVRLVGHIEGEYSLAIVNRGLAGALSRALAGRLAFVPWHGERLIGPLQLPAGERALLERALAFDVGDRAANDLISIVGHWPLIADPAPAGLRFILFFWEETAVPAAIVRHLTDHFDAVLVAARFVQRALRNSGCPLPIFVVPLGVDHLMDATPAAEQLPTPGTTARLLHVSSAFDRKGVDLVVAAYFAAFTAADAVELYIKTFPNPHNRVHELLAAARAGRSDAPRVVVDEAPLDSAQMTELYRNAAALVLPTRGEGFNLPAAEAMALGVPVIVTGHGAHADFCTQATATLIPFRFAPSQSHLQSTGACWVEPDAGVLAAQLRTVVDASARGDERLRARVATARRHIGEVYRWERAAQAILGASAWLRSGAHRREAPLRLALVTPWRARCGIAEYSARLIQAWPEPAGITVHADHRTDAALTAEGPEAVRIGWQVGNHDSVAALLRELADDAPTTVVVQHQPSLFLLTDAVCAALAALVGRGHTVLLELHSTLPLLHDCPISAQGLAWLRQLDRLVVHQPDDLNHLLGLGLVDNVMLLPHGVVAPLATDDRAAVRAELAIPAGALVLGSFGFLLEHKGVDAIIDALVPLSRAVGRPVHFIGIHSRLDERSELLQRALQQRVQQQGLVERVHWVTDFRPVAECQRLLSAADYLLYPYRATRESASGAITIGLAALRPVLVTPLPIFADLAGVTVAMKDGSAADITAAVSALEADPAQRVALITRQREWLAEREWQAISSRFRHVLDGLRHDRTLNASAPAPMAPDATAATAQLLVDVSELYFRDARTGIQRVVRAILGHWLATPPTGFSVRPVYATAGHGYRYANSLLSQGRGHGADDEPVTVAADDHFLGLDLGAHLFPEAEQWLAVWRAAGVRIHYIVYDIIPLLYPEYSSASIAAAFGPWLDGLARQADSLLCISRAVAHDVRSWLELHSEVRPLPAIHAFRLGADIESSAPTGGMPEGAEQELAAIAACPAFLMVGTLEPRKGHEQVLAAFELLWRDGVEVQLVLVGKEGWLVDEFVERLRAHPELGRRLHWLEGISDEFLERVYAASCCLIAASWAEGFGLPLIEAARRGLPLLVRDIPVFREVAGNYATYFSGAEPSVLATKVRTWLALAATDGNPHSGGIVIPTWENSADQLISTMLGETGVR